MLLLLLATAGPSAGCGFWDSDEAATAGSWRRAPEPPLTPRELAAAVWTGREALIIGGSDAPPTPPGAGGGDSRERPPLLDGAAFNPRTGSWRRIADAPRGTGFLASTAVVGGTVYVTAPRNTDHRRAQTGLLAYRLASDRWKSIPPPPMRDFGLAAAGEKLIAERPYARRIPAGAPPGYVLGRDERTWRALPLDPLSKTAARGIFWNGIRLVMVGSDPRARKPPNPPLARAATLTLGHSRWRRLPDSEEVMFGYGFWHRVGSRLVNPTLGEGSETYTWGRPQGGILDPEAGTWSALPDPPPPPEGYGTDFGTGILTRTRGHYLAPHSLVLDMTRGEWLRIPELWRARGAPSGWTVVNAGRKLLVFGGARFNRRHPEGQLLNAAWLWTPPPPAG